MEKLLADTNIFGIAVDPEDSRRESVWETLDKVSEGKYTFLIPELVLAEIEDNPHKPTRKKEQELVDITVDETVEISEDIIELSDKLVEEAGLGIIDAQILATSILKECTFWTGDHELINEETAEEINRAIKKYDPELNFKYIVE